MSEYKGSLSNGIATSNYSVECAGLACAGTEDPARHIGSWRSRLRATLGWLALLTLAFLMAGCGPDGPRAVLKGERLIREGKYSLAVAELREAIRLIPTNAQAWNHLGLALHHNQQSQESLKAYRQALALDRKLSVVHYNIGCLLLEQNDPVGAMDPLTSYTYLQPRSAPGWLKLGLAQLKARRFDVAETSFKRVLELEPGHAEAANNLGVVQAHRRRPFEALASFNQALRHDSRFAPALLNASIVTYAQLNNPGVALQKLKQYSALKPPPALATAITPFANRLEALVTPPKATSPVTASTPPAAPAPKVTNPPPRVEMAAVLSNTPPRTNPVVAAAPPRIVSPPPVALTNAPVATNRTENVAALVHSLPRKTEVEVTRLTDDITVPPARDVAPAPAPVRTAPAPAGDPANEKRSLASRLNPFGSRTTNPEPRKVAPVRTDAAPAASAAPATPRYAYLNPRPGAPGNRAEAARALSEGVKAHGGGRLSLALSAYERAAQLDPSLFEAHHNLGLALYESGNTRRALAAFEAALALRPDSADARYNFALALKQGNYLRDAADQLERILRVNPADTRAHLSLGNLYAQNLSQPELAREHYRRVLEREPNHAQAGRIRLWLAANARG